MHMPSDLIPDEFIKAYSWHEHIKNGFVYMQIEQGMYGLPQVGILGNKLLHEQLEPHVYLQLSHMPGLWKNHTQPKQFTLVVDYFGVKYVGCGYARLLLMALQEDYEVSIDWQGHL